MSTIKTVSLVFYKGSGNFRDKLIRLWTASPYSHCEFGRSDGLYHSNDRFALVSRLESFEVSQEEWEVCEIRLPSEIIEKVERRQLQKNGSTYDWIGIIFSQVFRLGLHDKKRWFCSKSNADDLMYAYRLMTRSRKIEYSPFINVLEPIGAYAPHELAPSDLFRLVRRMEQIQGRSFGVCQSDRGQRSADRFVG